MKIHDKLGMVEPYDYCLPQFDTDTNTTYVRETRALFDVYSNVVPKNVAERISEFNSRYHRLARGYMFGPRPQCYPTMTWLIVIGTMQVFASFHRTVDGELVPSVVTARYESGAMSPQIIAQFKAVCAEHNVELEHNSTSDSTMDMALDAAFSWLKSIQSTFGPHVAIRIGDSHTEHRQYHPNYLYNQYAIHPIPSKSQPKLVKLGDAADVAECVGWDGTPIRIGQDRQLKAFMVIDPCYGQTKPWKRLCELLGHQQMYQALDAYLGKQKEHVAIAAIEDKHKIAQSGFDVKQSFRHR